MLARATMWLVKGNLPRSPRKADLGIGTPQGVGPGQKEDSKE